MAQLKDLIVNGASNLIGAVNTTDLQITTLKAPSTAGGTTYTAGTNGQVLLSNGTSVYWGSAAPTITESTVSGWGFTKNAGTVTSVQVQATSPVVSSTSTSQTGSLNTTISLANNYGDIKNPYASKTAHYVLAGPSSGSGSAAPVFRALVADDIPIPSWAKASSKPSYTASEVGALPSSTTYVSSFNGQKGAITYTAPVTSVNGQTGVVSLSIPHGADELEWTGGAIGSTTPIVVEGAINAVYNLTTSAVTDVSLNDSTRQLQKTINGTTSNITQLAFIKGSGTGSAIGGATSTSAPTASGAYSIAFGIQTESSATGSFSMGFNSHALGQYSIAMGSSQSRIAIPQGDSTTSVVAAKGAASIATGLATVAEGAYSIASGLGSYAKGNYSIARGGLSYAYGANQIVIGKANIIDENEKYALILGNGTVNTGTTPVSAVRSNALTVDWDGNAAIAGSLIVGSSSFGSQLPTTGTAGQIFFQEDNNSYVTQNQIGNAKVFYGTCSTATATTVKAVTCADFTSADLVKGAIIYVTFDNTNSGAIASLKLNVNSTGEKSIKYMYNNAVNDIPASNYLLGNQTYIFHYDGTNWVIDNMHYNTNSIMNVYAVSNNIELPLAGISKSTTAVVPTAYSTGLYGNVPATTANRATFNQSTGMITVPGGVKTTKIQAPTTAGGSTYGAGSSGQALMSNGSTVYWGNVASGDYVLKTGDTMTGALYINNSTASSSTSTGALQVTGGIGCGGYIYATKVYGAVFNDYAEYREIKDDILPGNCVIENGDGTLKLTTERLMRGCEIISDTYGFAIGQTKQCQTPVAVSGRVLAYCLEGKEIAKNYIGWPVCSGPNGTVSIMTEEEEMKYPSRIIGTISEIPNYEIWGDNQVKVNNRIWIRIK